MSGKLIWLIIGDVEKIKKEVEVVGVGFVLV